MGWVWAVVVSVVLAVPSTLAPDAALSGPTYLAGLALVVAELAWATARSPRGTRRPWLLLTTAAGCWLAGDTLQRLLEAGAGTDDGAGPPDVLWLASYPLVVLAVLAMVRARGLPAALLREVRLDVVVVSTAAAIAAWQVLVAPGLAGGGPLTTTLTQAAYPLGDVAIAAFALTLALTPGRRGVPAALLVACLGLTLPLDFVNALLPGLAAHLDGALLVVNGLLGAAALHPRRGDLTEPVPVEGTPALHGWRVVLLGLALVVVSLLSALPHSGAQVVPPLVASVVVSATVVARFYLVVRQRESAEAALTHQAHHDQLTGVANRALLMDRLVAAVRPGGPPGVVLVFVDLDGFKAVNDTWGHVAGDEVLCEVARRLTHLVRPGDTVARVGGDEFVLLCHGVPEADAEPLGNRIGAAVAGPVDVGAAVVRVGSSVGVITTSVTTLPPDAAADELLRRADTAMYAAKRDGGGVRVCPQTAT